MFSHFWLSFPLPIHPSLILFTNVCHKCKVTIFVMRLTDQQCKNNILIFSVLFFKFFIVQPIITKNKKLYILKYYIDKLSYPRELNFLFLMMGSNNCLLYTFEKT